MKKHLSFAVKILLVTFVATSSGAALHSQLTGSKVDPIKAIVDFQLKQSREPPLEEQGEYTWWRKIKSTVYGAVTGTICDKYSAYGAISTDYTVAGDLRDLVWQGWNYLANEEVDGVVVTLSAYGLVLSTVPNPLKTIYITKGFLQNPIVVLGLSRSHLVIHTLKILKKCGLAGLAIPLFSLFLVLSLLPPYLNAAVLAVSVAYLVIILFQIFKIKGET